MFNRRSYLAIASIGIVLVLGTLLTICLYRPRVRAKRLLDTVSALEVGKSTFDEAQQIAIRVEAIPSVPCSRSACTWYLRVDNSSIPRRWRGPGATFSTEFKVKDSVVSELGFGYQVGTGPNISFAEVDEQVHWKGNTTEPVFVNVARTATNPYYRVFVRLTSVVPEETRKRYLSFDFGCLLKYGGCQNARDLLPTVDWTKEP